MKQILIIGGGNSYSSHDQYLADLKSTVIDYDRMRPSKSWKLWLAEQLPDDDVLVPNMPTPGNANYEEWVILFKKILPLLHDGVILVGHSLGAMFLAKYLQQNSLDITVSKLILISGGYDDDSLEDLGSFGVESATHLSERADEVHLFHSTDDPVVPFTELAKFQADLPTAISHILDGRGHFNDTEFPELLDVLRW